MDHLSPIDPDRAATCLFAAVDRLEKLLAEDPKNSQPELLLVNSYHMLGGVEGDRSGRSPEVADRIEHLEQARAWRAKALAFAEASATCGSMVPTLRTALEELEAQLAGP